MVKRTGGTEPWRIGVLFSRSGVTAVIEETQLQGTILAIEEVNASGGVNGREIEPVCYDPGSDVHAFARYASKLLTEDGVSSIFGCYTSSSRKAVVPIVERHNGLLWYPTLYEGFEYSPNVIYTGAAPNQNIVALVDYMLETYGSRFYLVGSDYIYPRESNRIMRELLRQRRGKALGEHYLDLGARRSEFRLLMRDLRNNRPDVVFSTVVGESTAFLYQAYAEAGFDPRTMPIASLTTSEAEVSLMTVDAARGHITAAPYFESVRTDRNAAFVRRYNRRFGDDQRTNLCVEAAYFQIHIFARSLAEVDTMNPDVLKPVVLSSEYEAPQGLVSIDADNGHTSLWTRVGRVNAMGQFDVVRESMLPVRPDPYLVSH
ncbi:MAG: amino acid ABC transporter substrate-binding protein [Alphaproteobacteria bacterium]|nr:amino acid ABC transporter substrate-binding protein [Alphaproteobacteria bacterium]